MDYRINPVNIIQRKSNNLTFWILVEIQGYKGESASDATLENFWILVEIQGYKGAFGLISTTDAFGYL